MANKLMKQCSTSAATMKTQIKSTMSYHYVPPFTALHIFVLHSCCIFFLQIEENCQTSLFAPSSNSIVFLINTCTFFLDIMLCCAYLLSHV